VNSPAHDPEEIAALAVLDELGRRRGPEDTSVPEPEDEIEEVLRRLHVEALGRLPYALPPVVPPTGLKAQLLRHIRGDETQEVEPLTQPSPVPAAPTAPEPLRFDDSMASFRYAGARRKRRRWALPLALAAALVAAAGLGLWVAYLQSELAALGARQAFSERQLKGELTEARSRLAAIEGSYELVTSPAVTVFPLHCPTGSGPAAAATARLYVAPDHEHWQFEIRNIRPEPQGHDYQIWFLTEQGAKSGACFNIENGEAKYKMLSPMPKDMIGVAVTLEPKGGSPYPTTPMLLVNREPVRL